MSETNPTPVLYENDFLYAVDPEAQTQAENIIKLDEEPDYENNPLFAANAEESARHDAIREIDTYSTTHEKDIEQMTIEALEPLNDRELTADISMVTVAEVHYRQLALSPDARRSDFALAS